MEPSQVSPPRDATRRPIPSQTTGQNDEVDPSQRMEAGGFSSAVRAGLPDCLPLTLEDRGRASGHVTFRPRGPAAAAATAEVVVHAPAFVRSALLRYAKQAAALDLRALR